MTPVCGPAASNGPPPLAPSTYRKAMRLPSGDQRGRSANPRRSASLAACVDPACASQSWGAVSAPLLEMKATRRESGDQAGPLSSRSWAALVIANNT
jgi:hypothetical protein